ncbi:hypothetical protein SAMN04487962_12534 [Marinobacter segnicrescens]|uniref:Uncharacterized protein n=1 Tax=Marinobacter segnicrescens TaxID=430453 RepID=A0A1I0HAR2_9GAMM|nr:hypothetical protein [Marinobacter segnicrescens]SET80006.1 hypothetical protein SAMN04487962_12534 [Marinobacter segnicrescens]
MYAKLDSKAQDVIVYQTKAVLVGEIDGKKRAKRKIFSNETVEVTRWSLGDQPDHYQVSMMGESAEEMMTWARKQDEQIKEALTNNLKRGLAGGVPVIVGSSAYQRIKDKDLDGFISDARTGEFCGIIDGARSIASVMSFEIPEPLKVPEVAEEHEEAEVAVLPSLISDQLTQVATGLLKAISQSVDEGQIDREELYNIYEAERQIYYTLTRGLGIKANEYETARRKNADRRFGELKKGSFGLALRQAANMLKPQE